MPETTEIMPETTEIEKERRKRILVVVGASIILTSIIGAILYYFVFGAKADGWGGKLECSICHTKFDTYEELEAHMASSHPYYEKPVPTFIMMSTGAIKITHSTYGSGISDWGVYNLDTEMSGYVTTLKGEPCPDTEIEIYQEPQDYVGVGGYHTKECGWDWLRYYCYYQPHDYVQPTKSNSYKVTTDDEGRFSFKVIAVRGEQGTKSITFFAKSGMAQGQAAAVVTCTGVAP